MTLHTQLSSLLSLHHPSFLHSHHPLTHTLPFSLTLPFTTLSPLTHSLPIHTLPSLSLHTHYPFSPLSPLSPLFLPFIHSLTTLSPLHPLSPFLPHTLLLTHSSPFLLHTLISFHTLFSSHTLFFLHHSPLALFLIHTQTHSTLLLTHSLLPSSTNTLPFTLTTTFVYTLSFAHSCLHSYPHSYSHSLSLSILSHVTLPLIFIATTNTLLTPFIATAITSACSLLICLLLHTQLLASYYPLCHCTIHCLF